MSDGIRVVACSQEKSLLLSFFYYFILLSGLLLSFARADIDSLRLVLFGFLFFGGAYLLVFLKSSFSFRLPDYILTLFLLYTSLYGVLKLHTFSPFLHGFFLWVSYFFIKLAARDSSWQDMQCLSKQISYIVAGYILLSILFLCVQHTQMVARLFLINNAPDNEHFFIGLLLTPNSSADVLFTAFLCMIWRVLILTGEKRRVLCVISSCILMCLITLTESRSVIFPAILLVLSLLGVGFFKKDKKSYHFFFIVLTFFFCSFFAMFLVMSRHHASLHLASLTLNGRLEIWRDVVTYTTSQHQLVAGSGFGLQKMALSHAGYSYSKTHSSLLDIFIGTGFIGLSIFLVFLCALFFDLIKALSKEFTVYKLFFLLACIALFIHSLVESYLLNMMSPDWFCFLLFYFLGSSRVMYALP